jgi:hypothetical protein
VCNFGLCWPIPSLQRRDNEGIAPRPPRLTIQYSCTQRKQYFLPTSPPIWCITGPGLEAEKDARWQPKWPYRSAAWRGWLVAKRRGDILPVPNEE